MLRLLVLVALLLLQGFLEGYAVRIGDAVAVKTLQVVHRATRRKRRARARIKAKKRGR